MLFWIFVFLLMVSIAVFWVGTIYWDYEKSKMKEFLYEKRDTIQCIGFIGILIMGVIVVVMFCAILFNNFSCTANAKKYQQKYTAITYKLESGSCRDEFGLLSKSVIDEIQDWNEDVAYYQNIQRDFWLGIFYPNVYDEFEIIDYGRYRK